MQRSGIGFPIRYPITGSAGCCARPKTGHAAAPASPAMNCRRFMALK
jgi:hypothetical protein